MKTKFYAWGPLNIVEKREISSETTKTVTLASNYGNRRENKLTDDVGYFDTFKEAQNFLLNRIQNKIEQKKIQIKQLEETKKEIIKQKESECK